MFCNMKIKYYLSAVKLFLYNNNIVLDFLEIKDIQIELRAILVNNISSQSLRIPALH